LTYDEGERFCKEAIDSYEKKFKKFIFYSEVERNVVECEDKLFEELKKIETINSSKIVIAFVGHGDKEGNYCLHHQKPIPIEKIIKYLKNLIVERQINKQIYVVLDQCYAYKVLKRRSGVMSTRPPNLHAYATSTKQKEETEREYRAGFPKSDKPQDSKKRCTFKDAQKFFKDILLPLIHRADEKKLQEIKNQKDIGYTIWDPDSDSTDDVFII
jgi:hypothetical protein